jgi:hypothetical protein
VNSVRTKNHVASVLARLRNEADLQRVAFNQVLQFYAIERFLFRLSVSPHAQTVLLKGALLLKTVGVARSRPTMDIDLLRRGKADRESLIALVRDCARIADPSDGVTFDADSIIAEDITKDSEYVGTRVRIAARMDNVRLRVQIDFGVGDAVFPNPRIIEYPTFLNRPALKLHAYPIEAAIAEKFQTMIELDATNSRMKDFHDVRAYARSVEFDGQILAGAIATTFKKRSTPLPTAPPLALTAIYFGAPIHQQQWKAFARRIGETELENDFAVVIAEIEAFLMPPTAAAARLEAFAKHWKPPGPWIGSKR